MKSFTTPYSQSIIATLRIVSIEKPELTLPLILYFHDRPPFNFLDISAIEDGFLVLYFLMLISRPLTWSTLLVNLEVIHSSILLFGSCTFY